MQDSSNCARLRHTYLTHVDDLGRAEPQLFTARTAVKNSLRDISAIEQTIHLTRSSAASGVAATGRMGWFGIVPTIAIVVDSEEKIARLERQLEEARLRLSSARRMVADLELAITGYRWGIDHTPTEMAQNGCDPV